MTGGQTSSFSLCLERICATSDSFCERKVNFSGTGHINRFALLFHALVPGDKVVLSVRNILDLKVATGISLCKIRRRADHDVA